MENIEGAIPEQSSKASDILKPLISKFGDLNRIFVAVLGLAIVLGAITGYSMVGKSGNGSIKLPTESPKSAIQDTRTFRDFAEGTLRARPAPKNPGDYVEGSHLLVRDGVDPVALTSSVVDLSRYEGKKVKVYGETQKALKEGWFLAVGRVEQVK